MCEISKNQILAELGHISEEVYDKLCLEFYSQAVSQIEQAGNMFALGRMEDAAVIIHSVKGCAANLRILSICEKAEKLEGGIKSGFTIDKLEPLLKDLHNDVLSLKNTK